MPSDERNAQRRQVIYGLPVSLSAIHRLALVCRQLGEGAISLFADDPAQVDALGTVDVESWPGQIPIWVNIDVGYHREGVSADSKQLADLASSIAASQRVKLAGVYTHHGASYASSSPEEALEYMAWELEGLERGALSYLKSAATGQKSQITLSLGATPTATAIQNLLDESEGGKKYTAMLDKVKSSFAVEIHAGVYPVMDMQQLAARARPKSSPSDPNQSLLSYRDLGFRILAEVASVYSDRGNQPEALIAAGSIVLGREPCKSYSGWAVVTPWPARSGQHYDPEGDKTGWIVGRVSQEHGILTWEGPKDSMRHLSFGDKLLLWPNHACIAGVNFGWYLVVDSDSEDSERIQDVWLRWRGW